MEMVSSGLGQVLDVAMLAGPRGRMLLGVHRLHTAAAQSGAVLTTPEGRCCCRRPAGRQAGCRRRCDPHRPSGPVLHLRSGCAWWPGCDPYRPRSAMLLQVFGVASSPNSCQAKLASPVLLRSSPTLSSRCYTYSSVSIGIASSSLRYSPTLSDPRCRHGWWLERSVLRKIAGCGPCSGRRGCNPHGPREFSTALRDGSRGLRQVVDVAILTDPGVGATSQMTARPCCTSSCDPHYPRRVGAARAVAGGGDRAGPVVILTDPKGPVQSSRG